MRAATPVMAQMLTEVGNKELGPMNTKVIGLSPGTVATDMLAEIRDANMNAVSQLAWFSHIPSYWVGEAAVFLCGPGGAEFAGTDFSLKTPEGRRRVGLPSEGAPDSD